jgi:hypothetical protein
VKTNGRTIRATGVLQKRHDRIRLDGPVPIAPGRVSVTIRPAVKRPARKAKELDILDLYGSARARTRTREKLNLADLAGIGREMLKGIDVDKWLDQMRNEWDREDR